MPRGDGTGPAGLGPMTGRAAGYCAGWPTPGFANFGVRRGYFGWGRGWRNMYYATGLPGWARMGFRPGWQFGPGVYADSSEPNEAEDLKRQARFLQEQLEEVNARLRKLEKPDTDRE